MSDIHNAAGNPDAALQALAQVPDTSHLATEAHVRAATIHLQQHGDVERYVQVYEGLVARRGDVATLRMLGDARRVVGNDEAAIKVCDCVWGCSCIYCICFVSMW